MYHDHRDREDRRISVNLYRHVYNALKEYARLNRIGIEDAAALAIEEFIERIKK